MDNMDNIIKHKIYNNKDIENINYTFNDNKHVIHFAALYGNIDLLKKCINNGISVNKPGGKYQSTPLYFAFYNKNYMIMFFLLEMNANPNYINLTNRSLYELCIYKDDILAFLLLDVFSNNTSSYKSNKKQYLKTALRLKRAGFVNYLKEEKTIHVKIILFFAIIHFLSFIYDVDTYIVFILFVVYYNLFIYVRFLLYLNLFYTVLFSADILENNITYIFVLIPYYKMLSGLVLPKMPSKKTEQVDKIGIIRQALMDDKFNEKTFCVFCCRIKTAGIKHCSSCNVCIDGFDHHCPCLDSCISANVSLNFHFYLLYSMALCVLHVICSEKQPLRCNMIIVFLFAILALRIYIGIRSMYKRNKIHQT